MIISDLFNYIDLPTLALHGKQKQAKRTSTFFEFVNCKEGILICTDVAARGLDVGFPSKTKFSPAWSYVVIWLINLTRFLPLIMSSSMTHQYVAIYSSLCRTPFSVSLLSF